jgi:hypothetical protein
VHLKSDKKLFKQKSVRLKKENSILKVLAYFSLFDYPVTKEEIQLFLDHSLCIPELSCALLKLINHQLIFQHGNFYSLNDSAASCERRIRGNVHAESLLAIAYNVSKTLFRFPFVRGVCISGSLSKKFADKNADIDFFIITKTGKLWVARTLMHLLKKIAFLTGKQHWYCMNYYIDEEALLIEEKNEFSAIEMMTLLPVCGNEAIPAFFKRNGWVNFYLPNYASKNLVPFVNIKDNKIKKYAEYLLNSPLGNWLDNYFMKITQHRWEKKENSKMVNKSGQRMGLRTSKHFCKPNPDFLQKKIVSRYHIKLEELEKKYDKISKEEKSIFLN